MAKPSRSFIQAGFILVSLLLLYPAFAQENLIKNPSFEEKEVDKKVNFWARAGYSQERGVTEFKLDTKNPHSGEYCAMSYNQKKNHSYYTQAVKVKELSIYKFSAWIRTENIKEENAGAGISVIDKLDIGGNFKGTNQEWKNAELYIKVGKGVTSITVMLDLGNYGSETTGKAWFDDVSLVEVSEVPAYFLLSAVESQSRELEEPVAPVYPLFPPIFPPNSFDKLMFLFLIACGLAAIAGVTYFVFLRTLK